MFSKSAAKYTFRGEAGTVTDVLDGKSCVFQEIAGGVQPCADKVFMGSKAGFTLKYADKVVLAQSRDLCQALHGKILRKMFADIGGHSFGSGRFPGMSVPFRAGRVQEKGSEQVVELFGDQRFFDRLFAAETFVDSIEAADGRQRIGKRKDVSGVGHRRLIERAGGGAVEMTPDAVPSCFAPISMGAVTVDQNKISGGNVGFFVVKFQSQAAALDIHDKKTVVGGPFQPVAGLVEKAAGADRVKKHIFAGNTGRIKKILGIRGDKWFAGFHKIHLLKEKSYREKCSMFHASFAYCSVCSEKAQQQKISMT